VKGIPEKVSEQVRQLNPHLFGQPEPVDRPFTKADALSALEVKEEKKLQALCECQLEHWGYLRLMAGTAGRATVGYFGHLAKPIGNPLMADLFIFDLRGRCLMVELKTRNVYQDGQREMIQAGFWKQANNFSEFVQIVKTWEQGANE
jgi:hypothetical protein